MKTTIAVLVLIILWASALYADQLIRRPAACEQIVMVPGFAFVRVGESGGKWGPWQQAYLPPPNARSWRYQADEWPKPIDQREVRLRMGERNWEWFKTNNRVFRSGWFNLSGDRGYDWKAYAGDHFP